MQVATEKLPPNSIKSEEELIGRVMLNPEIAPQMLEMLETRDFYSQSCQSVWNAIKALTKAQMNPDMHTVSVRLSEQSP